MGSIYKRGSIFWIKYYSNRKAHCESSGSSKKMVAQELLKKREGEIQRGKLPGVVFDRIDFGELVQDFLWDRQINNQGTTEAQKRIDHLEGFFGGMKITQITDAHIRGYIEHRKVEGAKNATINRELSALKRIFHLGAKKRPPKVDMSQVPVIKMLTENNTRKGFFEYAEYMALKNALPEYLRSFCTFAYKTGWRKEEISSLTWNQVDLRQGIVRLEPGTTKNGRGRTVYLDKELIRAFEGLQERRKHAGKVIPYVFLNRKGNERIRDFRKTWLKACKEAGIGNKIFHDFRRTAVRNMVRSGISEHTAMKISGHRSRSVFDRYDIISDNDLKEAAERQEKYIENEKLVTKLVTIGNFKKKEANRNDG